MPEGLPVVWLSRLNSGVGGNMGESECVRLCVGALDGGGCGAPLCGDRASFRSLSTAVPRGLVNAGSDEGRGPA